MTVSTTPNRITFTGTGTTNPLTIPYKFLADGDLGVTETIIATGVETPKVLTTDYTVSGAGDANGGSVTPVANIPTTVTWTVVNDPAVTQGTDLVENDPLPAESLETMADRLTIIAQRIRDVAGNRTIRQPEGDTADIAKLPSKVSRADKLLAFDSAGNPTALALNTTGQTVSPTDLANTTDATKGDALVGFQQVMTGSTARTVHLKLNDVVNGLDFGVKANDSFDNKLTMQAAMDAIVSSDQTLILPPGKIRITAKLTENAVGFRMMGEGIESTILKADGNFTEILELQSSSAEVWAEHMSFDTTGTTTRCVSLTRAQTPHFNSCQFKGDGSLSLMFSTGDIVDLERCRFDCDNAATIGFEADEYNQNDRIQSCRFGGVGLGVKVSRSGANARVEGLKLLGNVFINTGTYNVQVGDSLLTVIEGNVLDQAATNSVKIDDSADAVLIGGNWLGLASASTGVCAQFTATAGGGHIISNNRFNGGNTGIGFTATGAARVDGVNIDGNVFAGHANETLSMDSVLNAIITNNRDTGTPTNGSWITSGTFGNGSYSFDNNRWHTAAPSLLHTASSYTPGNDTGIKLQASGKITVGSAATSLVVTHTLATTPDSVRFIPEGSDVGNIWLTAVGATTFTANWAVSSTPVIHWGAKIDR